MPRPRERACLQDGLKLDLNRLARRRTIFPGARTGKRGITWTSSYWGEVASGSISADMSGGRSGTFRIELDGDAPQEIELVAKPRHFGGTQWYFVCPRTGVFASVIWRPSGVARFYSRQAFGRSVAYRSQFLDPDNRAHHGQNRIKARLLPPGMDPDEWDLPPKPKGMRWRTYQRYVDRFDDLEERLDAEFLVAAARYLRA